MTDYNLQKYATLVRLNPDDPEAHFGYGFALEDKGELQPAMKEYQQAVKLNPKHGRSYLHQGFITCLSSNDLDHAAKLFGKANELDPNLPMIYKDPANARFYQKRIMDSLEKFQGPAIRNPNDGHAHLLLGKAYRFFDKPEMALASLKKALEVNNKQWEAYDESGQIYAQIGQNQQAIINFQRAVEANPKYADAQYNLGVLYDKEGNTGMAIRLLQKSLELDANMAKAHYSLGKAYMRQGKTNLAIKCFQQAIDLDADNPRICYALAQACETIYRLEFAAQMYKRAIELDDRFSEAYYQLGMIYLQTARIEDAIEALENVVRINPTDAYAYYNLAEGYRKAGESDKAISHYYNSIGLNPKDAFAHYNLGLVYASTQQHDKAIEEYQKALELKPQDAHFHRDLAVSLRALGRYQEAIRELENTVEVNPNDVESQLGLAVAYQDARNLDQAIQTLQKVLSVRSDVVKARELLCECFVTLQAWDYAFEELQKLLELDAANTHALTWLGHIYLEIRNKPEQALEFLQRAVASDPNDVGARLKLADAFYRIRRDTDAFTAIEEAFSIRPDDARVLIAYAFGLDKRGRRDEAIRFAQKASTLAPEDPLVWGRLAELYEKNAQVNLAIEHYLEALAHDEENIDYMLALGRLYTRLDKINEAKLQYNRILDLQPHHLEAESALETLFGTPERPAPEPALPATPVASAPMPTPTQAVPKPVAAPPAVAASEPASPEAARRALPPLASSPPEAARPIPPPPQAAKPEPAPSAPPPTAAPPPELKEPSRVETGITPGLKATFRKAVIAHSTGKLEEAQNLLEQVLQENPDHFQSYYYMGLMARERGDKFQARMLFDQGLDLSSQAGDTEFYQMFETEMAALKNEKPASRRSRPGRSEGDTDVPARQGSTDTVRPPASPEPAAESVLPGQPEPVFPTPLEPATPEPVQAVEATEPVAAASIEATQTASVEALPDLSPASSAAEIPQPETAAATEQPTPTPEPATPPQVVGGAMTREGLDQIDMAKDFLELGKVDRAAAKLEQILEAYPDHVASLDLLGTVRVKQGRLDDAVACWDKCAQQGAVTGFQVSMRAARMYQEVGQTDKAREQYIKALDQEEANPEAVDRLCRLEGVEADPRDSMGFVQKLLKDRPQHMALTLKLGHIYRQMAKYSLAVVQYNKALRLREAGESYAHLARAYDKLGKRDSAVKAWENAVRLEPANYVLNYCYALEDLVAEGEGETARTSVEVLSESAPSHVVDLARQSLNPGHPRTLAPEESEPSYAETSWLLAPTAESAVPNPGPFVASEESGTRPMAADMEPPAEAAAMPPELPPFEAPPGVPSEWLQVSVAPQRWASMVPPTAALSEHAGEVEASELVVTSATNGASGIEAETNAMETLVLEADGPAPEYETHDSYDESSPVEPASSVEAPATEPDPMPAAPIRADDTSSPDSAPAQQSGLKSLPPLVSTVRAERPEPRPGMLRSATEESNEAKDDKENKLYKGSLPGQPG